MVWIIFMQKQEKKIKSQDQEKYHQKNKVVKVDKNIGGLQ
jgi:hypothetical protein